MTSTPSNDVLNTDLNYYWQQFSSQFKTEKDCVEELYKRFRDEGAIRCKHCGSSSMEKDPGERVIRCSQCNKNTWFLSGTFFNRIRLTRPWLAAIWLMEQGARFNSSQLHRLVEVAYSTALSIFKKVTIVVENQMDSESLTVPSSLFTSSVCKRSRETPARQHPCTEQEVIEKQQLDNAGVCHSSKDLVQRLFQEDLEVSGSSHSPDPAFASNDKENPTTDSLLGVREKNVYEFLSETSIHFDELCEQTGMSTSHILVSLTLLELEGLAIRMPGDWYQRPIQRPSSALVESVNESTEKLARAICEFVGINYHGISRKYLQIYLAAHWCHIDRTRWTDGSLLRECIRFRSVSYAEILDYVSPFYLKISSSQYTQDREKEFRSTEQCHH